MVTNEISGASLSSNQITLPAGTYEIQASMPANHCNRHNTRLYNVSDSTVVLSGTSEYAGQNYHNNTRSFINGRFTIAASKTFRIEHRCEATYGDDFGVPSGTSFTVDHETYTVVLIRRVD